MTVRHEKSPFDTRSLLMGECNVTLIVKSGMTVYKRGEEGERIHK